MQTWDAPEGQMSQLSNQSIVNATRIGWVGLGKMGSLMAYRLLKAHYPVTIFNRSKEKEKALVSLGATTSRSPAALMEQSDVIFVMVSDDKATREIFTGENGLLRSKTTGKIVINTSTVSAGISRNLARFCKQQGNEYLDAPVSGSTKQAGEGQLVIMVGGEEAIFQVIKPILEHLATFVLLVGSHGNGNSAKLAMNILLGFNILGLAESIVFARRQGINIADLTTLIDKSALGNTFNKTKGEAIIRNNYKAEFALHQIAKDLRLAREAGKPTPLLDAVFLTFQEAELSLGEEDVISIVKYLTPQ